MASKLIFYQIEHTAFLFFFDRNVSCIAAPLKVAASIKKDIFWTLALWCVGLKFVYAHAVKIDRS